MDWKVTLDVDDHRTKEDPTIDSFLTLLDSPIIFDYNYDAANGTHSLKLKGFWSRYQPSYSDFDTSLFKDVSGPEEVSKVTVRRGLSVLRSRLWRPNFGPFSAESRVRVSLLLYWLGHYNEWKGYWSRFLREPALLTYHPATSPFVKLHGQQRYTDVFTSPARGGNILLGMAERRIVWFEPTLFNDPNWRVRVQRMAPSRGYLTFHFTFAFNTPHATILDSREDLIVYLHEKVLDQIEIQKHAFDGMRWSVSRSMEGVAVIGDIEDTDSFVKNLRVLPMMWIPPSCYDIWRRDMTISEIELACSKTIENRLSWGQMDLAMLTATNDSIWMPLFLHSVTPTHLTRWPTVFTYALRARDLVGPASITMQKVEPAVWASLPTGDILIPQVVDVDEVSSTICGRVAPVDNSYDMTDNWGGGALLKADLATPPTEAELATWAEQALKSFVTDIPNSLYQMRDLVRYLNVAWESLVLRRQKICKLAGEVKPDANSSEIITRAALFSGPVTIADGRILPPMINVAANVNASPPPKQLINNATVKEISLFLILLRLKESIIWDREHAISQKDRDAARTLILLGPASDYTKAVLTKIFPRINVKGLGLETTISGGKRANIFESYTYNFHGDYLLSDIDQTGFAATSQDFDNMVDFCCRLLIFCYHQARYGAVKINHPSPYLFARLVAEINNVDESIRLLVYNGHGQNALTPEIYIVYYPAAFAQTWVSKSHPACQPWFSYDSDHQTPAQFTPQILNYIPDKNFKPFLDFAQAHTGSIVMVFTLFRNARMALNQLLMLSDRVLTWRLNDEATGVYFAARIERARLGITKRSQNYYDLQLPGVDFGKNSFGASSSRQVVPAYTIQPWYTIINYACRYRFGLYTQAFDKPDMVHIIGARDFGEVCEVGGSVPITVYDFWDEGIKYMDKYNITTVVGYWDYTTGIFESKHVYWFNFVLMAPNAQGVTPTAIEQLGYLKAMINSMKLGGPNAVVYVTLYVDSVMAMVPTVDMLPNWPDFRVTQNGATFSISVGQYAPVEMLSLVDITNAFEASGLQYTIVNPNYADIVSAMILRACAFGPADKPKIALFNGSVAVVRFTKA